MKKFFVSNIHLVECLFIIVIFIAPIFIFAQIHSGDGPINVPLPNPLGSGTTLATFVAKILAIVRQIGVPVVIFFVIFSGFLYVTAQGNSEKLKIAHKAILWTLVGAAILLGAEILARAIQGTINQITGP